MSTLGEKIESMPPAEREILLRILGASKAEEDPLLSADLFWSALVLAFGIKEKEKPKVLTVLRQAASSMHVRDPSAAEGLLWAAAELSRMWGEGSA